MSAGVAVKFQAERLTYARKRRQVAQAELARRTGLTPRSIQRYEAGEEPPKAENLARIAGALSFPTEFFVDPRPLPELPERSLSFRAYSKLKARVRDNAVCVAQMAVGIEAVLAEHFELPPLNVPNLSESASSAALAARSLRDEWGLGDAPIWDMVAALEQHGVRVFSLSEDAADVDAFCFWHSRKPFVVLDLKKSGERGRFDAAHELAHLTLHREIEFSSKDVEREANEFASEFLVPSEVLRRQLPSVITHDTVLKLKRYWKVSAMAMVRRLKDVGRLTDWVYRSMCIEFAQRGYRDREPDGIERERSELLADMINTREGISVRQVADELRVRPADISPLVFDLPHARGHLRLVNA